MKKENNENILYALAAMLGAVSFILIYGIYILNPFYTDWLISGGDLTQHYLGWEYFRRSEWLFPFGLTNQLGYPATTSVIYTDSIPFFAVIFKLLTKGVKGRFQYFGIWGLCCFMLQGYWSARILNKWLNDKWQILLGSLFFILSPIVIFRMYYHTALAAHWLILMAIYFCAVHKQQYKNVMKTSLQWGVLGVLIGSIHLYFVPMCAMLLGGYILYSFIEEKKIIVKYIFPGISFVIGLFTTVYLLGGFSSGADAGANSNLGLYSFNLNGFYNPIGYSKVLKWLEVYTEGQYEGFAYLGLGVIVLVVGAVASFCFLWKDKLHKIKENWLKWIVAIGVITGLVVLAASPKVTFNEHLLFEFPDIDIVMKYWGIFGSCGRIIWPVYYLIVLFAIVGALQLTKKTEVNRIITYLLLIVCLALQIYDTGGKLKEKHNDYAVVKEKKVGLENNIWEKIDTAGYEHVAWISHNIDRHKILYVADWALEHKMTMSNFYFARAIDLRSYAEAETKQFNEQTLYLFVPGDTVVYEDYHNFEDELNFYEADGLIIGSVQPLNIF